MRKWIIRCSIGISACLDPSKVLISDYDGCFNVMVIVKFLKEMGRNWKTVSVYAQISNGKDERMVEKIKIGHGDF